MDTRHEHDLLGGFDVPVDAYYGVHTARAVRNFTVTGSTIGQFPRLISSLAAVKEASALANAEVGGLAPEKARAIVAACREIREGRLHDQFVVDPIQGGAGTSTNMNANEVIANRALEILDRPRGDYNSLDPLQDVNLGQSTNDSYPTALRVATILSGNALVESLQHLEGAFSRKALEFQTVVKVGRTQLQDAVPMTLGQEFSTYAVMVSEDIIHLREALSNLREINLGATAIGTGITCAPGYAESACKHLSRITGFALSTAPNLIEATQDCDAFVSYSGVLKRVAVKLSKVCNDLRLLSSGPRAGFAEINLPATQAGSSIMPGKVNPVIPELVNQIAFEVVGNDLTVTMAAEAGQLQLNPFEPIIAYSIFRSTSHLDSGCKALADLCIEGITANVEFLKSQVASSIGTVTVLNSYIGYAAATEIAQEALRSGRTIVELVLERGLMDAVSLANALGSEAFGPQHRATR